MKPLLPNASQALRAALEARGNLRTYHSNEELFSAGEPADFLPVIVSGRVKMIQFPDAGKEVIIGIFGKGEMFAVPPVIDGKTYPASAYAMVPSQILLIHRDDFFALLRESFEFTLSVLGWLSDMLRQKTRVISTLAGGSAKQRIAGVLIRLSEADGGTGPLKINLRREDLARMAGLSTETAIRTVRSLAASGDLRIVKGKIYLDGVDRLKNYLAG